MNPSITLQIDDKKGVFEIDISGKIVGKLNFSFAGNAILIIEHTEVNPSHHGKSFGKILVEHAVTFAREKGFAIIPECSFAKKIFERTPEFNDVLN